MHLYIWKNIVKMLVMPLNKNRMDTTLVTTITEYTYRKARGKTVSSLLMTENKENKDTGDHVQSPCKED